jgi:hypothetical protein
MELPPVTPQGILRELARQPRFGMRVARGWIFVGSIVAVFACAMAIAHFGYEVPVQNNDTGRPATAGQVMAVTSLLAGGGGLFIAMGVALRRWLLSRSNVR